MVLVYTVVIGPDVGGVYGGYRTRWWWLRWLLNPMVVVYTVVIEPDGGGVYGGYRTRWW